MNTVPRLLVTTLAFTTLTSGALAQSFSFPDFSSTNGLAFNGTAAQAGNVLRVTAANLSERGSVWYDQPIDVAAGFDTTFTFQVANQSAVGGDGMAFLIQNDPAGTAALGNHASAMGYGGFLTTQAVGIDNSLAVEIDTYSNGNWNDLDDNHMSVHTAGTGDNSQDENLSIGRSPASSDMSDGFVHTVRIRNASGLLEVFLDDLTSPLISVPYSFGAGGTYLVGGAADGLSLIGGTSAYVGFTAGNGGEFEDHDVLSWNFTGGSIGNNYCGPAFPNSTGIPATIAATGSNVVSDNNLTLVVEQMPSGQFGYFLAGQTQGFFNPPGSQGIICLMGNIGRYNQIANLIVGPSGSLLLDLGSIPVNPPTPAAAGETWSFQCWYRDNNPTTTSNFTDGLEVLLF